MTKSNLEKIGFIVSYSLQSIIQESQGKTSRQELMLMEEFYFLAHFLGLLRSFNTQDHASGGTIYSELDPPTSVTNQKLQ